MSEIQNSQNISLNNSLQKIQSFDLKLNVFGAGYVGLPTAALFANMGFTVTAVDIKKDIVKSINNGVSPIEEIGLTELISINVKLGRLNAELFSEVSLDSGGAIILTVQTPINTNKKPDLSFLMNALTVIGPSLKKGAIVIICSTIPPGTIQKRVKPLLETASGLKADKEFYLAYVPERIAPGNALKEFVESPRLVGGVGPNSTMIASVLFRKVCKNILETDAETAEISKTAENTFRDINIAFANQLALICEQHGADITKVIKLANTHPRVNIHTSGPGVGGPCLTKDPYLLTYETEFKNSNLIEVAREINDYMPHHMVELIKQGLIAAGKSFTNSCISILGTSYKADVDDPRLSPAEPMISKLIDLNANVTVYDPHCEANFGAKRAKSFSDALKGSDCLVIVTDHKEFAKLDLCKIKTYMKNNPFIVDGKRIVSSEKAFEAGFEYYGIGFGIRNCIKANTTPLIQISTEIFPSQEKAVE